MDDLRFYVLFNRRWCKKFKSGVESVEDAPHARRPKTATSQKIVGNWLLPMQDLQLGI